MMCGERLLDLSAHVDSALSSDARADIDAHLVTCATCRATFASLRVTKHAAGRLASREEPPGAVRARIEALRFARPRLVRHRFAALLAACIALIAGGVVLLILSPKTTRPSRTLTEELVADHLKSVPEVKPVDIASSDPRVVAQFFAGRTRFAAVVPSLPGATLIGGRACKIAGRPVELLFYRAHDATISLFVTDARLATPDCQTSREHTVCGFRRDAHTFYIVGKRPADELRALLEGAAL